MLKNIKAAGNKYQVNISEAFTAAMKYYRKIISDDLEADYCHFTLNVQIVIEYLIKKKAKPEG